LLFASSTQVDDGQSVEYTAAQSHNVDMMAWLVQQPGIELTVEIMRAAVSSGDVAMCELLLANQCPFNENCCYIAAIAGVQRHENLDVLRWLRQHGCPWDCSVMAYIAAIHNSAALIEYLLQQGVVFTSERLTCLLNAGGAHNSLEVAKWLRE
jgi:hypothetical protein